VLEHIADPLAAMRGLRQVTAEGGAVILTTPLGALPHSNVYSLPDSYGSGMPYICRQHTMADVRAWEAIGFSVEHVEHWRAFDSPYWSVGPLMRPLVASETPAHLACMVLRRRP
jgi:hypothetical protein